MSAADEFWVFCIILVIGIILSTAGMIYFSLRIVRNKHLGGRTLASKDDMIVYSQAKFVPQYGSRQTVSHQTDRSKSQNAALKKGIERK